MRGRLIKIERPKGYVNIDEVYEALDNVEKEVDYEYGDFGEVLSKWATCDYDEVLDSISCCDVVKAIPLDKIKQTIEEIEQYLLEEECNGNHEKGIMFVLEKIDKLIEEVE